MTQHNISNALHFTIRWPTDSSGNRIDSCLNRGTQWRPEEWIIHRRWGTTVTQWPWSVCYWLNCNTLWLKLRQCAPRVAAVKRTVMRPQRNFYFKPHNRHSTFLHSLSRSSEYYLQQKLETRTKSHKINHQSTIHSLTHSHIHHFPLPPFNHPPNRSFLEIKKSTTTTPPLPVHTRY